MILGPVQPSPAPPSVQSQAAKGPSAANPSLTSSGTSNSLVYERIGYYQSTSQTVDNLVFLGNHGGQGSGVFD